MATAPHVAQSYAEMRARLDEKWAQFPRVFERFGFTHNQLYSWRDNGCPYLQGDHLRTDRQYAFVNGGWRKVVVYYLPQLEQIAANIPLKSGFIWSDSDGQKWYSALAAKNAYGIWDASLGDWQKQPCPFLGRPVRFQRVPRLTRGRKRTTVTVYLGEDLEAIAKAQQQAGTYFDEHGQLWLFAREAERLYGYPAHCMWYYRRKSYPNLPTGRIRAQLVDGCHALHCTNRSMDLWVYLDEDLWKAIGCHGSLTNLAAPGQALPDGPQRREVGGIPTPIDPSDIVPLLKIIVAKLAPEALGQIEGLRVFRRIEEAIQKLGRAQGDVSAGGIWLPANAAIDLVGQLGLESKLRFNLTLSAVSKAAVKGKFQSRPRAGQGAHKLEIELGSFVFWLIQELPSMEEANEPEEIERRKAEEAAHKRRERPLD